MEKTMIRTNVYLMFPDFIRYALNVGCAACGIITWINLSTIHKTNAIGNIANPNTFVFISISLIFFFSSILCFFLQIYFLFSEIGKIQFFNVAQWFCFILHYCFNHQFHCFFYSVAFIGCFAFTNWKCINGHYCFFHV